uniref:F-box domain-containing protein n=1 Tax=Caenorhabditis tropicalis TaxID=1561998 RepID=A0A1I7UPH7_9PELO
MKPLSYPLYDYILPHLEFTLRTNLVFRCPFLSRLHDKIPIKKIHKLHITSHEIHLDNITFTLGVAQVHPNGQTPEIIRRSNKNGGFKYDVDRYGFSNPTVENDYLEEIESGRDEYEMWKKKKEAAEKIGRSGLLMVLSCEGKMKAIYDASHFPFILRENNEDPPYTHRIQLKIEKYRSMRRESSLCHSIEQVEYQKSLIDAKKYLINRLFSNKTLVIRILKVDDARDLDNVCGSNISVDMMVVGKYSNNETLRNCRNLVVSEISNLNDFIDDLHLFQTPQICFKEAFMNVPMSLMLILVLQGPVVTRHLKIATRNWDAAVFFYNQIALMPGALYGKRRGYHECLILPKSDELEINVYVTPMERQSDGDIKRLLHFQINPKGYAIPDN